MFFKPRPGVQVRRPTPPYAPVPADGAEVGEDSYWYRRIADGDGETLPSPAPTTLDESSGLTNSKETSR